MKVKCLNGFFIFEEMQLGQVADFISLTKFPIVTFREGLYTFEALAEVPEFSIIGSNFLGILATKTFQGEPWELFKENEFVFDFSRNAVAPISTITTITKITQAGNRFISPGLILPGSLTQDGLKIQGFTAYFSRDTLRFNYSEVTYFG